MPEPGTKNKDVFPAGNRTAFQQIEKQFSVHLPNMRLARTQGGEGYNPYLEYTGAKKE